MCAYVSGLVIAATHYHGLNLKSFSPAWLCRSGTPQRPNGAKSDTRSQICGWWLSYLCLFHLRSPKVVCVSEKGTHHLLTAAAVVSACVVLCVGGWVGGWVANNTEASVSQSISQHPPPCVLLESRYPQFVSTPRGRTTRLSSHV